MIKKNVLPENIKNKTCMDQKRDDVQIYILGHKPIDYGVNDNALYSFLQVGNREQFTALKDSQGENIAKWNPIFAESTGTYWIAHNAPKTLKYVGQVQYRRRMMFDEGENFDNIFNSYDAICAEPLFMRTSVYNQLAFCHNGKVAAAMEQAVKELYPEMAESFDKYLKNSGILFYSNSFVTRRVDFDRYVEFMSKTIFRAFEILGCKSVEDVQRFVQGEIEAGRTPNTNGMKADKDAFKYQCQLGGFMSERLWTLWVQHSFAPERIKIVPWVKFEGV